MAHGGGGLRGAPLTRGAGAAPAAPAGSGGGSSGLLARRDMSEAAPAVPCTAGAPLTLEMWSARAASAPPGLVAKRGALPPLAPAPGCLAAGGDGLAGGGDEEAPCPLGG